MKGITEGITSEGTRTPIRLSATFVKAVTKPGRYGDGRGSHGLSLLVKPMKYGGHSRTWSQRLRISGKPVSIGLGSFPIVTLVEARKAALENRRALAQGHDPRNTVGNWSRIGRIVFRTVAQKCIHFQHEARKPSRWARSRFAGDFSTLHARGVVRRMS